MQVLWAPISTFHLKVYRLCENKDYELFLFLWSFRSVNVPFSIFSPFLSTKFRVRGEGSCVSCFSLSLVKRLLSFKKYDVCLL